MLFIVFSTDCSVDYKILFVRNVIKRVLLLWEEYSLFNYPEKILSPHSALNKKRFCNSFLLLNKTKILVYIYLLV